ATFTVLYVVPFYVLPGARSSPTIDRDAPSVIQQRIRAVTISSSVCSLGVFVFLVSWAEKSPVEALSVMGWWPPGFLETAECLLLTAILFAGPLFERGIIDGELWEWIDGTRVREIASDWAEWRNYVAAPITEEVVFRSVMTSIQVISSMPPTKIIFITPLYFGIAHVHHLIQSRLCDPGARWLPLIIRTVVQFAYTTLFGWYATFLLLRTGSLLAVCLVHSFCNINGLPRFWGRIVRYHPVTPDGPDGTASYEELPIVWTYAYYALLVAGALAFKSLLWTLTVSDNALVSF
ncbi:hypothetical protein KEM56_000270, partial [Ascosphaera pollenicola]